VLWVRARRDDAWRAAVTVAHEARHAWQARQGWAADDGAREPDAYEDEMLDAAFYSERLA